MTAERAALDALIESVADGTPVDWSRVERDARDEPSRRHLRDLRLVAEIAALHKSHVGGESGGSGVTLAGVAEGTERWGHLILLEKIGEGSFGDVYRARDPTAYKLAPSGAFPAMLDPSSPVFERAQVIGHTLWVTPFHADERWPCGEFVNQSVTDEGLAVWTQAQRPIADTDVVLWYVFGIHHVPRVEDWPVMPVDIVSFRLAPSGFFDRNPSLDVAPQPGHGAAHCTQHGAGA